MRIYIVDRLQNPPTHYRANLTMAQAKRHDNGALISIGLAVDKDLRPSTLRKWLKDGTAVACSHEEWNHSGCLSSCVNRGAETCHW